MLRDQRQADSGVAAAIVSARPVGARRVQARAGSRQQVGGGEHRRRRVARKRVRSASTMPVGTRTLLTGNSATAIQRIPMRDRRASSPAPPGGSDAPRAESRRRASAPAPMGGGHDHLRGVVGLEVRGPDQQPQPLRDHAQHRQRPAADRQADQRFRGKRSLGVAEHHRPRGDGQRHRQREDQRKGRSAASRSRHGRGSSIASSSTASRSPGSTAALSLNSIATKYPDGGQPRSSGHRARRRTRRRSM